MLSTLVHTVAGQALVTVGLATLAFLALAWLDTRAARVKARRAARWERAHARALSMKAHPSYRTTRYVNGHRIG